MSGSGISWAICKYAPCPRQISMPASHHSVFLQAGCPSCHPTNSVKGSSWQQNCKLTILDSKLLLLLLLLLLLYCGWKRTTIIFSNNFNKYCENFDKAGYQLRSIPQQSFYTLCQKTGPRVIISHSMWKCNRRHNASNVQNGVPLYGHKPRDIVSIHDSSVASTTVCCMTHKTTLRCCCSCSCKCFKNHSKWSSILLLQTLLPIC